MLHTVMEPDTLLVVLGASDQFSLFNTVNVISYALIVAKKLISLFWKKAEVTPVKLGWKKCYNCLTWREYASRY